MSLASPLQDAPLLKSGVLHAQVEGGTYVELGERSFFIRGDKLYPVVSRLLGSFDGARAAAEIRAGLPEKIQPLFDQLLDQLTRQRMLTSGPADAIAADHPYASTLHFFRDATSRWREAFAEWTQARITLAGSPQYLPLLARAITAAGSGNVIVADAQPVEAAANPAAAAPDQRARSLLLYIGAQAPDEATLAELGTLAAQHEVSILAAVCEDVGIVGPDCRDGLGIWQRLAARVPDTGLAFTQAAVNVLAALLAFEAMQERIAAWSDDGQESVRRQTQFRVVRGDGSVSSHDSEIFLASGRTLGGAAVDEALTTPADAALIRFYDRAAGLFSDATAPGPEYPLAHRALLLNCALANAQASQRLLYDWGPDLDAAEQRLMAQAFAALVAAKTGHTAGPGVSPVVAAASQEQVRARAAAYVLAGLPAFLQQHPPCRSGIGPADDADVQMLVRLIHLYTGSLPAVWKAGAAEAGACVVWAAVGEWTAAAVAADFPAAVFEALGEALSAFQLGRLTDRQQAWPLNVLRVAALPGGGVSAEAVPLPAAVFAELPALQYVAVDEPCLPPGWLAGHMRLAMA